MIINACLMIVKGVLTLLLLPLRIITFPAAVASVFANFISVLVSGAAFCSAFMHTAYIGSLLAFVFSVSAFVNGYRLIMWALKKIPFLNIH